MRTRSRKLASALADAGMRRGDRLATLAWNTHRHLEVYYGVSGFGAVCHTLNPRLHPGEIVYIMNHAEDRILFVDATFVAIAEAVADALESVERYVILTDAGHMPGTTLPNAVAYEDFIAAGDPGFPWPDLDENSAMGHPGIAMAAVIGVPDEKWGERPLLVAVPATEPPPSKKEVLEHLSRSLVRWQLPDEVIFVDALPMGGTGKVQKTKLREEHGARTASTTEAGG